MRKGQVGGLVSVAVLLFAGTVRAQALEGAGSTFVSPLMNRWAKTYAKEKKVTIKYEGVGSGAGVKRFLEKKVDFACTDVPLTKKVLADAKKSGNEIIHVPLALGAVVPVYNLRGVEEVRFTGPVLADIYLGKITKWNDPALTNLNPTSKLPDLKITVVSRADSSGTSLIWTEYLGKVSKEARAKLGVSSRPKWPVGVGAKGNAGVGKEVGKTPGAIGYVELVYALGLKLGHGPVQNSSGTFVRASRKSVAAALMSLKTVPADLRFNLTNAPGKDAYPIAGATWAVVYAKQPKAKAKELTDFLSWVTHEGQQHCQPLHYVPLPKAIVGVIEKRLKSIGAK
jgi:phosphate transport system substrate-binding protein